MLFPHGRHHGSVLRRLEFPEFSVLHVMYKPSTANKLHAHEEAMICTTLDGCSAERSTGTTAYLPPGDKHRDITGPNGWEQVIIELRPGTGLVAGKPQARKVASRELHVAALSLCRALIRTSEPGGRAVRSFAYEMIAHHFVQGPLRYRRPPAWLNDARDFISAHFRERPSIDCIASSAGVHPIHLAREFQRWFGMTVGQAVRRFVMADVVSLLAKSDLPAAAIASLYGYNPSHFSQLVRRETGYRVNQLRSNAPVAVDAESLAARFVSNLPSPQRFARRL